MHVHVDIRGVRLETERLILRPWTFTDLDDLNRYATDRDVGPMAGWQPHESLTESKIILMSFINGRRTLALEYKETGQVIGSIGIEPMPKHMGISFFHLRGNEIGYVLAKDMWGKGLMTEAVQRVIKYCFDELKLDLLLCGHFVHNGRSARVIQKSGFEFLKIVEYETQEGMIEPTKLYILRANDYYAAQGENRENAEWVPR